MFLDNSTAAQNLYSSNKKFVNIDGATPYSFSGSDVKVYGFFPEAPELIEELDTFSTVSVSVHEAKAQVRSFGYRGIRGITRSQRTIAGSIILTVLNDHPLRKLMNQYVEVLDKLNQENSELTLNTDFLLKTSLGWSVDMNETGIGTFQNQLEFQNRLSGLLPPFNLYLEFVSETAPITQDVTQLGRKLFPGAGALIEGIEIIDEGMVVSVNNLNTEITLSYLAKNYRPFSANIFHDGGDNLTMTDIKARELELFNLCYPEGERSKTAFIIAGEQ